MRYVLVGPAYPFRGGISQFNARLYRLLVARGHEVVALNFRRQYPDFLFPGRTQRDLSEEAEKIPAVPVLDSIQPVTWLRAADWVARHDPDVLVFHHWMPFFAPCYGTIGYLTRLATRVKVVWICHNLTPHERQPGADLLNRYGLASGHGFVVMSEAVERDLLRMRRQARYRRILHPVTEVADLPRKAEARRRLGLPADVPVLLFFGYVRRYKGLDVLLRALPEVLRRRQVRVLVAGEFYEPVGTFRRVAEELGVTEAVVLRDVFVPNEQVPLYFAAADVVVLPYRSATQSGIVPMAYAHERPVVTTRVGGLPEVVEEGKTGFLADPEDPSSLAAAILRFLEVRDRVDWAAEIRRVRERMSWGRFVDALEELVAELTTA